MTEWIWQKFGEHDRIYNNDEHYLLNLIKNQKNIRTTTYLKVWIWPKFNQTNLNYDIGECWHSAFKTRTSNFIEWMFSLWVCFWVQYSLLLKYEILEKLVTYVIIIIGFLPYDLHSILWVCVLGPLCIVYNIKRQTYFKHSILVGVYFLAEICYFTTCFASMGIF